MTVFSVKSERKLQRNKVSRACFQCINSIAVEDGKDVEMSPFDKDVCCLIGTEIINQLKELSGTNQLALNSWESWRPEEGVW